MAAARDERGRAALVVGAGPVGLALALELERHGVPCRIIDQNEQRTDKSKALVLWSRTLEVLDDMGGAAPFVAAGMPGHGMSLYDRGKRLLHVSLDDLDSPYRYALMLPQSETERLLEERLAARGVAVERRTQLASLAADASGVTAVLRQADGRDEQVHAAWLLGCDGAHSTVRHQLGVPFAGEVEPNDWVLADVHVAGPLPDDELSIFWHTSGILAFFPIAPGRFRAIADVGLARSLDHPPDPTLAQVQATIDERGPGGLTLSDPVWLSGFRIHERKVAEYRHGRVFLAGDAAHIHSPAGGQGMNTGIQDAYNLGWKLGLVASGRARDGLLDTYASERGAVGEVVLRNAAAMTRVATLRNPIAQAVRARLAPLLASFDFVRSRLAATLAELEIDYGKSPLSGEHRGASAHAWLLGGGVAPGSRAPDAALVEASSGRPTRLHEALHGTSHVLLALSGVDDVDPSARRLARPASDLARRYGDAVTPCLVVAGSAAPGDLDFPGRVLLDPERALHARWGAATATLYLVRPDGYVGHRSQPADEDALRAHLDAYLVPTS
jgi:2-polyprenyl-6-methoxyphenol hydroxylase-like FAD-dependent oxidoreductase